MKCIRILSAATFAALTLVGCGEEETAPEVSSIHCLSISGTFAENLDNQHGNLSQESYPFQGVLGGSFEGTFSYDESAQPYDAFLVTRSYRFLNAAITIKDRGGNPVYVVDLLNSEFRTWTDQGQVILSFGDSTGEPNVPDDIRFELTGNFPTTGALPPPEALQSATLHFGFLETDGPEDGMYWVLPIAGFSIANDACSH